MKRILAAAIAMSAAAIDTTIAYQGVLRDAQGNVLSMRAQTITFRLYSQASGGTPLWARAVAVNLDETGLFNVELGRKGGSLIGAEEKDLYDKMTTRGMKFYYLPTAILYHIIPASKLTQDYFDRLTHGIGVSERYRTQQISRSKYRNRLFKEAIKWGGTLALWCKFALQGETAKGNKLVAFRRNVTRGLLGK